MSLPCEHPAARHPAANIADARAILLTGTFMPGSSAIRPQEYAWAALSMRLRAALPMAMPITSAVRLALITADVPARWASFRLLLSLRGLRGASAGGAWSEG
jgi:hypothetical protein